ncbi:hypothetical protein Tsubulata_008374 [Turnera subulata]|uniref:NHL repeat-containing protein n=1 Tax=Turnera subulata TaxID=218843 RepID=A0A9Q0FEN0_9ROSI|nr:hypothetical protein Tsubulata_008374 [Turnera subulata]
MRRGSHLRAFLLVVVYIWVFQAHAAPPAGPLIKHLSSLLKWAPTSSSSSRTPQPDANVLQFEDGYLVETVVEGNEIGVVPYKVRVSEDGELFAVDEASSNIVKITPPLSQYSRARLVAGSFQGYTGHVDGKPSEARFNHPRGVTMDDKGNLYVADTLNLAIRKIGDSGVTTIAGGKSNVAGYRDGPSEDAKFSNDFDVVYVHSTCSLLVVDRGNAALRQISLNQEDCDFQSGSITATDIFMVIGAVLTGYVTCFLQQGFGSSVFTRMQQQPAERNFKKSEEQGSKEKPTPLVVESMKEEPRWPSFGQLIIDLSKLALEALGSGFLYLIPSWFRSDGAGKGLTPLKDSLIMPEDEVGTSSVQRQSSTAASLPETRQVHGSSPVVNDKYSDVKPPKMKSGGSYKDPSLPSKHRSLNLKRHDYADFYGPGDIPPYIRSKTHKEKPRHRQRDKNAEVETEPKSFEGKPVAMGHDNPRFDHYSGIRSKYGPDSSYRF